MNPGLATKLNKSLEKLSTLFEKYAFSYKEEKTVEKKAEVKNFFIDLGELRKVANVRK